MTLSRRRFLLITAGAAFGAIGSVQTSAFSKTTSWRGVALGADASLVISGLPKAEANSLIALARDEIERYENIFSLYRRQNALSTLNETGQLDHPPLEMLELFSKIDLIHQASDGLFDPTIQPLWALYAENGGQPKKAEIGEILHAVGWPNVRSNASSVKFKYSGMALTLNGIAQGFITDRITQLLKANGLTDAVVNMGEISAIGHDENHQPWRIGIARSGDEFPDEHVNLTNRCIATSSPATTIFDGKTSHIINPKSGMPASPLWRRVSVIHKSATIADGVSTAAILMSPGEIKKMLDQIGNIQIIAINSDWERFQWHRQVDGRL